MYLGSMVSTPVRRKNELRVGREVLPLADLGAAKADHCPFVSPGYETLGPRPVKPDAGRMAEATIAFQARFDICFISQIYEQRTIGQPARIDEAEVLVLSFEGMFAGDYTVTIGAEGYGLAEVNVDALRPSKIPSRRVVDPSWTSNSVGMKLTLRKRTPIEYWSIGERVAASITASFNAALPWI